jgi:hypothetical protein
MEDKKICFNYQVDKESSHNFIILFFKLSIYFFLLACILVLTFMMNLGSVNPYAIYAFFITGILACIFLIFKSTRWFLKVQQGNHEKNIKGLLLWRVLPLFGLPLIFTGLLLIREHYCFNSIGWLWRLVGC